uniref:Mediator complex subunit 19 n=1 Tax=Ascaris lumbricoides TaxID=6252 RepID=A0A0M3IWB9_ASCLU
MLPQELKSSVDSMKRDASCAQQVRLASLAQMDLPVHLDLMASLVHPALPAKKDLLVLRDRQEKQDQRVLQVPPEKEHLEKTERKVRVKKGRKGRQVHLDHQGSLGQMERKERMERQDRKDRPVLLEKKVLPESQEHQEHADKPVYLGTMLLIVLVHHARMFLSVASSNLKCVADFHFKLVQFPLSAMTTNMKINFF